MNCRNELNTLLIIAINRDFQIYRFPRCWKIR